MHVEVSVVGSWKLLSAIVWQVNSSYKSVCINFGFDNFFRQQDKKKPCLLLKSCLPVLFQTFNPLTVGYFRAPSNRGIVYGCEVIFGEKF